MDLAAALLSATPRAKPNVIAFAGGGGKSSAMARLAQELVARGQRVLVTTTTHLAAHQSNWFGPLVEVGDGALDFDRLRGALDESEKCLVAGALEGGKRKGIAPQQVDKIAAKSADLHIDTLLIEADGSRGLPVKAPAPHEPVLPACTTLLVSLLGLDAIGATIDEAHVHRPEIVRRLLGLPADHKTARLSPALVAQLLAHELGGAKSRPVHAAHLCLLNKADSAPRRWAARLVARRLTEHGIGSVIAAVGQTAAATEVERWAPLAAVVLAAGEGRRMGGVKQLVQVEGVSLLERAVCVALQSGVEQVMVVTGAHADTVEPLLRALQARAGERLRRVHNPDWASGQASSVAAAIAVLPPNTGAVIFQPVDQPFLEPLLLRKLATRWRQGAQIVAPSVDGEIRGAPALFDRAFWPALCNLSGDVGGKVILRQHRDEVASVAANAASLRDLDTPADLVQTSDVK